MGPSLRQETLPPELADLQRRYLQEPAPSQRIALLKQLVERAQALKLSDSVAWGSVALGMTHKEMGQYREAIAIFQSVIDDAIRRGDLGRQFDTQLQQAVCYTHLSQPERARPLLDLVQREHVRLPPYEQAGLLLNLGFAYHALDQTKVGFEDMERAARLYEKIGEPSAAAQAFLHLAGYYVAQGRFADALGGFQAAIRLQRQAGNWSGEIETLHHLAESYAVLGMPAEQLAYLNQAVRLAEAHRSPESAMSSWSRIAQAYERLGDFARAQAAYERGLATNADPLGKASLERSLAALWMRRGEPERALPLLLRALDAAETLENWHWTEGILSELVQVYGRLNQPEKALALVQKSQALAARQTPQEAPPSARVVAVERLYVGQRQVGLGQVDAARGNLTAALATFRKEGMWEGELQTLALLARVERGPAAERAFQEAIAAVERLRTETGVGAATQSAFFQSLSAPYVGYTTLLVEQGRADDAFAIAQRTKARGLLDLMAGGRIRLDGALSAAEEAEARTLRQRCDRLSEAMVREAARNAPGGKKRYEALQIELADAERDLALRWDMLYAKYPGLKRRRIAETVTRAQVSGALPADTALLEFAPLEDGRIALFVVTRGAAACVRLATPAAELERRVSALRGACTDPRKPWKAEARALYDALLAPADALLRGKAALVVCPDSALWETPFAVLTDRSGAPLAQRFALSYASSATTWQVAQSMRQRRVASPKLLVLANPQFDAEKRFEDGPAVPGQRPIVSPDRPIVSPDRPIVSPDRPIVSPDRPIVSPDRDLLVPRGTRLVDLPGTQREADALLRRFPDATVFTRLQAQEGAVKRLAGKFQRLHIASHAFVNDAAPLLSSIVLANPAPNSGDDGFLTAREIFDLDLSGVEMVVLSACNTARGERRGGEGVMGLTWALSAAGCPTQVLSLWAVDDASTAMLMTRFYDGLARGVGKGESLRQAALAVRQESRYAHPYYWAPFVLIGRA